MARIEYFKDKVRIFSCCSIDFDFSYNEWKKMVYYRKTIDETIAVEGTMIMELSSQTDPKLTILEVREPAKTDGIIDPSLCTVVHIWKRSKPPANLPFEVCDSCYFDKNEWNEVKRHFISDSMEMIAKKSLNDVLIDYGLRNKAKVCFECNIDYYFEKR